MARRRPGDWLPHSITSLSYTNSHCSGPRGNCLQQKGSRKPIWRSYPPLLLPIRRLERERSRHCHGSRLSDRLHDGFRNECVRRKSIRFKTVHCSLSLTKSQSTQGPPPSFSPEHLLTNCFLNKSVLQTSSLTKSR